MPDISIDPETFEWAIDGVDTGVSAIGPIGATATHLKGQLFHSH